MNSFTFAEINNFNGVIAERTDKQSLRAGIESEMIDASLYSWESDRLLRFKRRGLDVSNGRTKKRDSAAKLDGAEQSPQC